MMGFCELNYLSTRVGTEEMGDDDEEINGDTMKRIQSAKQQQPFLMNQLDKPQLNLQPQFCTQIQQSSPNLGVENSSKKVGILPYNPQIPPISPYSQILVYHSGNQQMGSQNLSTTGSGPSQPLFFALDSLPPLGPSPNREPPSTSICDRVSADVSNEERGGSMYPLLSPSPCTRGSSYRLGESLPPPKFHRMSNSDISFGFSTIMQPLVPLLPLRIPGALDMPLQVGKRESSWEKEGENNAEWMGERKSETVVVEDLFSVYMNLDNIDALNSSGIGEKLGNENREDLDSGASGTKTNGGDSSDNEATSNINETGISMKRPGVFSLPEKREGIKRNAEGDIAQTTRHFRSVSMDSFTGNINFVDESLKMPPYPGTLPVQLSPTMPIEANSIAFSLEFGNAEFNGVEMKKIMANEKLVEIAFSDPKRAKRILANRQSAAQSKLRKMRYIAELEHKVQTLQNEVTTQSAQITQIERDSDELTSKNNELKFRLQAIEQQAHLRDALNEALTGELQRLKLATADASKFQQLSIYPQLFQLSHQQATQLNMHQLQQQQSMPQTQSQQSNDNTSAEHESKQ